MSSVQQADDEAERAQLAFALGRFPEYWQGQFEAARARVAMAADALPNLAEAARQRLIDRYAEMEGPEHEREPTEGPAADDPGSGG